MSTNTRPDEKRRYKPGLNVPPHVARQLRCFRLWFGRWFRRVFSWPIFGAILGSLLIPSYPGQTKSSGLFDILFWVGCGTVGGLVIEVFLRWREKRASQRLANGRNQIPRAQPPALS